MGFKLDISDKYFLNNQFKKIIDEVYHGDKSRFGKELGTVKDPNKPMSIQSINTYYFNKQTIGPALAMTLIDRLRISELWLYKDQGPMFYRTSKDVMESEKVKLEAFDELFGAKQLTQLDLLLIKLESKMSEVNNLIQQIKDLR